MNEIYMLSVITSLCQCIGKSICVKKNNCTGKMHIAHMIMNCRNSEQV